MNCSVIVASNSAAVLQSSLLASPDLAQNVEISVQEGAASAALAYNRGIDATRGEVMVFVHQDVYLPPGWMEQLSRTVQSLNKTDPQWAVLGAFGIDFEGRGRGHLYSTGLKRVVGAPLDAPAKVRSLDEVLFVVRRGAGLRFDEKLPGFHLYGADICLQAQEKGLNCYAYDGFCIHNTNGIKVLPEAYWTAYEYLRNKWKHRLPIATPCMTITRWRVPALRYRFKTAIGRGRKAADVGARVPDPAAIFRALTLKTL